MKVIEKYSNYINIYSSSEGLKISKKIANLLVEGGFNNIGNHIGNNYYNNSVHIFSPNPGQIVQKIENTKLPIININVEKNKLFWGWSVIDSSIKSNSESEFVYSDTIVPIYIKGITKIIDTYIIGNYDIENNTLLLCDITHYVSEPLEVILKSIVQYNKKNNIIRKFEPLKIEKYKTKIKIGADPEFLLVDKNRTVINANKFIRDRRRKAKVGLDGCAVVGELRPPASYSPRVLTRNIKKLYTKLNNIIKDHDVTVYTGSGIELRYSVGGHIHFGGIKPYTELLTMLDDFIGRPLKNTLNGTRIGYGNNGDYEPKPYGFEYRTPPSFISNEKLTAGVLATALCIANTYNNLEGKFTYHNIPSKDDYAKLYNYKRYKNEIDDFVNFIDNKQNTLSEYDTLAAWQIK